MSIAEKLVTIAENTPKVCNAVQSAKTEVNGVVVVANDISTIEHPVEVTLSSETITDFSGVQVSQCGKNLYDSTYIKNRTANGLKSVRNADGSVTFSGTATSAWRYADSTYYKIVILPVGTYTASPNNMRLHIRNPIDQSGAKTVQGTFTLKEDYELYAVSFNVPNGAEYNETLYPQIEYGYEATEYEQYKAPTTYTANADGTVDGVMSLAPSMTLVSSDPEATINCRYFPVEAVGVRTAYADLVDAETALRDRLLSKK